MIKGEYFFIIGKYPLTVNHFLLFINNYLLLTVILRISRSHIPFGGHIHPLFS